MPNIIELGAGTIWWRNIECRIHFDTIIDFEPNWTQQNKFVRWGAPIFYKLFSDLMYYFMNSILPLLPTWKIVIKCKINLCSLRPNYFNLRWCNIHTFAIIIVKWKTSGAISESHFLARRRIAFAAANLIWPLSFSLFSKHSKVNMQVSKFNENHHMWSGKKKEPEIV